MNISLNTNSLGCVYNNQYNNSIGRNRCNFNAIQKNFLLDKNLENEFYYSCSEIRDTYKSMLMFNSVASKNGQSAMKFEKYPLPSDYPSVDENFDNLNLSEYIEMVDELTGVTYLKHNKYPVIKMSEKESEKFYAYFGSSSRHEGVEHLLKLEGRIIENERYKISVCDTHNPLSPEQLYVWDKKNQKATLLPIGFTVTNDFLEKFNLAMLDLTNFNFFEMKKFISEYAIEFAKEKSEFEKNGLRLKSF